MSGEGLQHWRTDLAEQRQKWAIIVHGGAKPWDEAEEHANRDGIRQAVKAGAEVL